MCSEDSYLACSEEDYASYAVHAHAPRRPDDSMIILPVKVVGVEVRLNLRLRLIPIGEQFLLVVEQLLTSLCRVFCVLRCSPSVPSSYPSITEGLTLDDGVGRAGFLAVPAVDALCHVEICRSHINTSSYRGEKVQLTIPRRPPRPVLSGL